MPSLVLNNILVLRQQELDVPPEPGDELRVTVTPDSGPAQTRKASGLKSTGTATLGITAAFTASVTIQIVEEDTPPVDPDDALLTTAITAATPPGPVTIAFGGTDDRPMFGTGRYVLNGTLLPDVPKPPDLPPTPPTPPTPQIPDPLHVLIDNPLQVLGLVEGLANINSALSNGVVGELEDLGDDVEQAAGGITDALAPLRELAGGLQSLSRIEDALAPLREIAIRLEGLSGLAGLGDSSGAGDVAAKLEGLGYINATLGQIESSLNELNDITAALAPLAGLPAAMADLTSAISALGTATGGVGP